MKYKFISPYLNSYISNSREKMISVFDKKKFRYLVINEIKRYVVI